MPDRFRRSVDSVLSGDSAVAVRATGVVTVAFGEDTRNLLLQRVFLRDVLPEALHVLVVDDEAAQLLDPEVTQDPAVTVVSAHSDSGGRPSMARGHNVGARELFSRGRRLAIFLRPDTVPLPGFFESYVSAGARGGAFGSWVFNGPITGLGAEDDLWTMSRFRARRLTDPSPTRTFPPVGDVMSNDDHHLFLADNFAMDRVDWQAVGGFCEDIVDEREQEKEFAGRCRAMGLGMAWVGGAHALRVHPDAGVAPVELPT